MRKFSFTANLEVFLGKKMCGEEKVSKSFSWLEFQRYLT